jgi:hypothetical protein
MHFSSSFVAANLASACIASGYAVQHRKQHDHNRYDANQSSLPSWSQRNLNTIEKIYNLTVYPNNVPIVSIGASAVPAGLFNENATGRISPLGNFTGFDDSIECTYPPCLP